MTEQEKKKKTTPLFLNITPVCLGNNVLNVWRKTSKRKKCGRPTRLFVSQLRASALSYFSIWYTLKSTVANVKIKLHAKSTRAPCTQYVYIVF